MKVQRRLSQWWCGKDMACCLFGLVLLCHLAIRPVSAQEPAERADEEPVFLEGIYCGVCHTNSERSEAMRDASGRAVAPFDLWRSSAMANSARDPYWRAVVSVEVAATPSRKQEIEQTCSRCHSPMAGALPESHESGVLEYLTRGDKQAFLALDGVSCTVCHQISDELLETPASYTGHYVISSQPVAIGPHAEPLAMTMKEHSGYSAVEGRHILKSALCGTCHTLITETLDPDGTATGHQLHEQSAYLEWRNSLYNNEGDRDGNQTRSCQACHVPVADVDGVPIQTRLARTPGGRDWPDTLPRSPFGRHTFVGGNVLLAQLLRDNAQELQVFASAAAFDATLEATRKLLQTETATVTIGDVLWESGKLRIPVHVENLTGHKFPTGFPSRRAWVRLEVRDAEDRVIFVSGGYDAQGRITDADGRVLASELAGGPLQLHHLRIGNTHEVQVYESVMADKNGDTTFTLLRGANYAKDNRLLPKGWQTDHPDAAAIAPVGVAEDHDFQGGVDVIWYEVAHDRPGPVAIQASLHYQSIGVRHVAEVFTVETPEVKSFRRMYEAADRRPETIDQASKTLNPQ